MRFLRQQDLLPPDRIGSLTITLIGAGAIGSAVALVIGKLGLGRLIVYDADVVDEVNLAGQLYCNGQVGLKKVDALAEVLGMFTETEVVAVPEAFDGQQVKGLLVTAVDSMRARRLIWKHLRGRTDVPLLLDARMGGLVGEVHVVRPGSPIEARVYRCTLHRDDEALREPCTARSISFNTAGIAAQVGSLVRSHLLGEPLPRHVVVDHHLRLVMVDGRAVAA